MVAVITLILELSFLALWTAMGWGMSNLISIILIGIFSISFFALVNNQTHYKNVSAPLILGYLFRVALVFFDIYGRSIYILPNSGADSEMFYNNGLAYAAGRKAREGFFIEVIGTFFKYCGESRLFCQFLLMLCSVAALLYAAKTLDLLDVEERQKKTAMWVVSLLPNFAILSSILLRESLVTMFITISLYFFVLWAKKKNEGYFIIAIALTLLGMRFHSGSIAVPVGYMFARLLYDNQQNKLRLTTKNLVMTGILLLASVYLLNRYGDKFMGKFQNAEEIDDIAAVGHSGGSNYARYVGNSNNPLNMIIYTIPRMVFFLFSPMPWMIRGISDIIAFLFSSCFYLITLLFIFRFLQSREKKNRELVILIFIVALCAAFVFGWGTSNGGTACRHRDKMVVVWGVLLGLTITELKERKKVALE